jgi:hypothetical protein
MTSTTFQIARRAFGAYTTAETVDGYVAAQLRAMALQAANADGEYMVFPANETPGQRFTPATQSPLDWL